MNAPAMARTSLPKVALSTLEFFADRLDLERAAAVYKEYGALVVRGLMKRYIPELAVQIEHKAQESIALLDQAKKVVEGWTTPNGTLFLPAPKHFSRDKQIMCLNLNYRNSSAFFHSAIDSLTVDLVEKILGPNIELFGDGQSLYKEPVGGHPKNLHQDSAYFEHRYEGPVATLSYVVPTNLQNGALHVVPGSHRLGQLHHIDTFSHLGLDENEWPWESALPIPGEPGDTIFFHYRTIHGSKENHSNTARPVFISRYRSAEDYITIGGTTVANREEREKLAAKATKEGQEGLMLRGARTYNMSQTRKDAVKI